MTPQQLKNCNILLTDRERVYEISDSIKHKLIIAEYLLSLKDSSIKVLIKQKDLYQKLGGNYQDELNLQDQQIIQLNKDIKKKSFLGKLELIGIGILTIILIIK